LQVYGPPNDGNNNVTIIIDLQLLGEYTYIQASIPLSATHVGQYVTGAIPQVTYKTTPVQLVASLIGLLALFRTFGGSNTRPILARL
jgi:hypothetical protein